ncbi:Ankyrin repeat protein 1 [Giardia muris]|uniref:Ankyrin repeat protein 1 n=1 Tax=Giardia muris TaxID=5742 RepID=A0A4Z1STT5_GIAMU|nr:Ankyrin repeat protein 1 [Giardia muris]|eukprot:TNJ29150.1 Ankyrin repeat protein 1 [Giardia muris]
MSETPLMKAVMRGDLAAVKQLQATEAKRQNRCGQTALMLAISYKRPDIALVLCDTEAGLTADNGMTALMLASQYGYLDVAKALIPHEARMQTTTGWSALMLAVNNRQREAARLLSHTEAGLVKADGWTALMLAAQVGYSEIVCTLMPHEATLRSGKGWTALMAAVDAGNLDCVALLVREETGAQRSDGLTALMIAARNGREDLVRILCDSERAITLSDGRTAYDFALQSGNQECIRLLEETKSIKATSELRVSALIGTAPPPPPPPQPPLCQPPKELHVQHVPPPPDDSNPNGRVTTPLPEHSTQMSPGYEHVAPNPQELYDVRRHVHYLASVLATTQSEVQYLRNLVLEQGKQLQSALYTIHYLKTSLANMEMQRATFGPVGQLPLRVDVKNEEVSDAIQIAVYPDTKALESAPHYPDPYVGQADFDLPSVCLRVEPNLADFVCMPCEHICQFETGTNVLGSPCPLCGTPINDIIPTVVCQ